MQALRELLKDWWAYCDHCGHVVIICPRCGMGSCSGTSCLFCHLVSSLVSRLDDLELPTEAEARELASRRPTLAPEIWRQRLDVWEADLPQLQRLLDELKDPPG